MKKLTEILIDAIDGMKNSIGELEEIFDIFLSSYHQSYKKIRTKIYRRGSHYLTSKEKNHEYKIKQRDNFAKLLYHLKKQGLVEKKKQGNKIILYLTQKGKEKKKSLELKSSLKNEYPIKTEKKLKIIIFDIPETQKRKRNWLRQKLVELDFTMLQKSVWMSRTQIPKEFLEDLKLLGLLDFVHIFEVTRSGSIKV